MRLTQNAAWGLWAGGAYGEVKRSRPVDGGFAIQPDAGDRAAIRGHRDAILLDQKTNAADWKGIISPIDLGFLANYNEGVRRSLPK